MHTIHGTTAQDYSTIRSVKLEHFTCTGKFKCMSAEVLSSQLNKVRILGSGKFSETSANQIHTNGSLNASNCRFGQVHTFGSCELSKSTVLDELTTSGSLNLTASKVHGKVFCSGAPSIVDSTIDQTLEIFSRKIQVKNSSIREIIAKPFSYSVSFSISLKNSLKFQTTPEYKGPQKVEIELDGANCKVGTVRFDTPDPGVVILKNGAPAPKVINGNILQNP